MLLGSWLDTLSSHTRSGESRHSPDAREHTPTMSRSPSSASPPWLACARASCTHQDGLEAARGVNWKPEKMLEAEDPGKPALQAPRMGVNLDLEATHSARLDKSHCVETHRRHGSEGLRPSWPRNNAKVGSQTKDGRPTGVPLGCSVQICVSCCIAWCCTLHWACSFWDVIVDEELKNINVVE